jgi:hypothetical protein
MSTVTHSVVGGNENGAQCLGVINTETLCSRLDMSTRLKALLCKKKNYCKFEKMETRCNLCEIYGFHGGDYEECRLHYRVEPVNAMQDLRFSWWWLWRMQSSGMLHHMAHAATRSQKMAFFRCNLAESPEECRGSKRVVIWQWWWRI